MAYVGPLAFSLVGAGLLVALVVAILVAIDISVYGSRRAIISARVIIVAITCALLYTTVMAPAAAWPVILGAVREATGPVRIEREEQIRTFWHYGEMRAADWFVLSKIWGVCHRLWGESSCRTPDGPLEAQGVAREILRNISIGRRMTSIEEDRGVSRAAP